MAYGSGLKPGDTVVTSRDSSRSARMLKREAGSRIAGPAMDGLECADVPIEEGKPFVLDGIALRATVDPQAWPAEVQLEHARAGLTTILERTTDP